MSFHEIGSKCSYCDDKVELGHPLLKLYWPILKREFLDLHVADCFRGESEQNSCFDRGKTQKKWPNSKHNYMVDGKPCSLALDFFKMMPDMHGMYPPKFYYDIDKFIIDNEIPLSWSGKWNGFKELDHFELIIK